MGISNLGGKPFFNPNIRAGKVDVQKEEKQEQKEKPQVSGEQASSGAVQNVGSGLGAVPVYNLSGSEKARLLDDLDEFAPDLDMEHFKTMGEAEKALKENKIRPGDIVDIGGITYAITVDNEDKVHFRMCQTDGKRSVWA